MSGVNGNVIMSACRDDNPDDERREAARDNTKSVSRGADGGGGRDGDRSQRATMLPDQRSGKRAPYTPPFCPRSASKASLPAGISGQSQCGWGHTVGSVDVNTGILKYKSSLQGDQPLSRRTLFSLTAIAFRYNFPCIVNTVGEALNFVRGESLKTRT